MTAAERNEWRCAGQWGVGWLVVAMLLAGCTTPIPNELIAGCAAQCETNGGIQEVSAVAWRCGT